MNTTNQETQHPKRKWQIAEEVSTFQLLNMICLILFLPRLNTLFLLFLSSYSALIEMDIVKVFLLATESILETGKIINVTLKVFKNLLYVYSFITYFHFSASYFFLSFSFPLNRTVANM